ncbi:Ribosomal lysine N-methyltransferase 4 [Exophiala dermatitidis]
MAAPMQEPDNLDFDQTSTQFVNWFAAANGTRLNPKVQLKDLRRENAGRGVVATADIAPDEELFAIPRSLVLTTATSSIPPSVLKELEAKGATGAWPPLIVTIIYEYLRGESSPWHPYFKILPTTFNTVMFWNDAELAELQASAVVDKIGRRQAEEEWQNTIIPTMADHPDLFPVGGSSAKLIELAHMAGSLIMAYAFDIDRDDTEDDNDNDNDGGDSAEDDFEEDDEDEPFKGMVPFADMLNADADKNNARLFQEPDYLIMKTTKPISAGEQIFNDYGPLPRSDLLRMYGYVTDNYAQYDVVEFSHDLLLEVAGKHSKNKDQVWWEREQQLGELGVLDDGYAITRPESDSQGLQDVLPGQVHMLLRALCAREDDSKALKKPKDAVTIEEAVLLQAVLTKKLSEYATSYETDQAIWGALQSNPPGFNVPAGCNPQRFSMALQVRMGEKQILRQLIALCQAHIKQKSEEVAAGASKRKHDGSTDMRSRKTARRENHR